MDICICGHWKKDHDMDGCTICYKCDGYQGQFKKEEVTN